MNNNILDNETLKLSEETTSASDGIISIVRSYLKRIRLNFARKSESSVMSNVLSNLYLRTLTGKIRYAAVFLLTFSIVSLIICYIANASIGGFISDIDSFSAVVLMAVSLLFFTTNKSFYSLIISSKFLSSLSIVYSDSSLFKEDDDDANLRNASTYSTPFFLGIICGIFTVIYPVGIICLFLVSIILVLLVFNRPESGLLLTVVLLPFLDRSFLIIFLCITFTSLLYKYLQAKRHISFNAPSLIIIITFVYVTVRFLGSDNNLFFSEYISYLVFFITCLVTLNVIRSTAMFRRVVLVLLRMSRLFAAMLIIYYLCNIFFGNVKVSEFMNLLGADSIIHSLTSETFIAPFIVMALPLNFSHLVGISKKNGIANNLLFVTMILACLVYVPDFSLILICVLSCVAILTIFDRKYGFLILISPFAAYAVKKIFDILTVHYNFSADTVPANDINESISVIKTHPLFGLGANATGYSGNMVLDTTVTLGLVGLVLLTVLVILMTLKSIKSVSASTMKSDKIRFLSIGLLCSQLSFVLICLFSDICCDINVIFMFSVIMSLSYVSGKCYEADFIDETVVREYK